MRLLVLAIALLVAALGVLGMAAPARLLGIVGRIVTPGGLVFATALRDPLVTGSREPAGVAVQPAANLGAKGRLFGGVVEVHLLGSRLRRPRRSRGG